MGHPRGPGGSLPFVEALYSLAIIKAVIHKAKRKSGRNVEVVLRRSIKDKEVWLLGEREKRPRTRKATRVENRRGVISYRFETPTSTVLFER